MKNITIFITILITLFGLGSCGIVSRESSQVVQEQSDFKQTFSLGTIVENHHELLLEGPHVSSGMEAGPREEFMQIQEEMVIQVDPDNTAALLELIQSDIEELISSSGATIVGIGNWEIQPEPTAYFSYNYTQDSIFGVINVWGVRGEGNTFVLIVQITESQS